MWMPAHRLIVCLYLLLPVATAAWTFRRHRGKPALRSCAIVAGASLTLGIAACVLHGIALGGMITPGQMAIACYFVAGLLCLLKWMDLCFDAGSKAIFRVGKGTWMLGQRRALALTIRALLLFGIGLPYMIAAAITFHPKAVSTIDPIWLSMNVTPVKFSSTDGLNLSGQWITAANPPRGSKKPLWGQNTVIICHGLSGNKNSCGGLAKELTLAGYNVFTFDFRAYGQSEGHMVSFGDLERRDVLGAVRWLKDNVPNDARHIHGIGVSMGAAALLAAAADDAPESDGLNTLIVCGCYDRFDHLALTTSNDYFIPPLRWLTAHIGVFLAGLQTGADLPSFAPADAIARVAPRPVLIMHSRKDRVVRFELGEQLFDAASAPKTYLWLDTNADDAMNDPGVDAAIRKFLDTAVPMI